MWFIRNENGRSGGTGLLHGILNGSEDGKVKVSATGLLGVGTTNDIGTWNCVSCGVLAIAIGEGKVP